MRLTLCASPIGVAVFLERKPRKLRQTLTLLAAASAAVMLGAAATWATPSACQGPTTRASTLAV